MRLDDDQIPPINRGRRRAGANPAALPIADPNSTRHARMVDGRIFTLSAPGQLGGRAETGRHRAAPGRPW